MAAWAVPCVGPGVTRQEITNRRVGTETSVAGLGNGSDGPGMGNWRQAVAVGVEWFGRLHSGDGCDIARQCDGAIPTPRGPGG
jgi:hypothetical protein